MTNRTCLAFLFAVLACATAHAQDSSTPRQLYERAAYAEEHEHDLEAAARGFEAAEAAATKSGDSKLASDAHDRMQRVRVRQGKAAAPKGADAQTVGKALARLLDPATLAWRAESDEAARLVEDLKLYGTALLPYLEQGMSEGTITFNGTPYAVNTGIAIRVLGNIDTPESRAALEKAFESRDPIVRKQVIVSASSTQRALFERGAVDPVTGVQDLALTRLMSVDDLALVPLFESAALRGYVQAVQWLTMNAPLVLLRDYERLPADTKQRANPFALNNATWFKFPLTVDTVRELLELSRSSSSEKVRAVSSTLLTQLPNELRKTGTDPAPFREPILRELQAVPRPEVIDALQALPRELAVEELATAAHAFPAKIDDAFIRSLNGFQSWALKDSSDVGSRAAWIRLNAELVARTAPETFDWGTNIAADLATYPLKESFAKDADPGELLRWLQDLPPHARKRYLSLAAKWLEVHDSKTPMPKATLRVIDLLAASGDSQLRTVAIGALGPLGDPTQIERAIEAWLGGNGHANESIATLARIDPAHASEVIWKRLEPVLASSKIDEQPGNTVRLLDFLPDAEALASIRRAWPLASPQVRTRLASELVERTAGREATQELLARYREIPPQETNLRWRVLTRFGDELFEPAIPLLGEELRAEDKQVRAAAQKASDAFKQQRQALEEFEAWTTAAKGARESIDELKALLASPNRDVVVGAIKALGVVKARTALPELVKLLERKDPEIVAAVQTAIDKIGQ